MITACSEAQIMPLSNVLDKIKSFTACWMFADFSMKHGTLPGPTPSAGLPVLYADLTMPEPPVAKIKATFG